MVAVVAASIWGPLALSPAGATAPTWSISPTPANPAGTTLRALYGVSCPASTSCMAVGETGTGSTYKTLTVQRKGTTWTVVPSANPSTSNTQNVLSAVRCLSSTDCIAVGKAGTSSASKTLVERWNGTTWKIVASANGPTGSAFNSLASVFCTSSTNCWAVGSTGKDTSTSKPLVLHWTGGTTWTTVASPNPSGATYTQLSGVSCSSSTYCFAVGTAIYGAYSSQPVSERWNGSS